MNYRKSMKKKLHKIAKHTDWDVHKINKNHYQIWVNPKRVTLYQNYPFVKIRLYHNKPAKVRFNWDGIVFQLNHC